MKGMIELLVVWPRRVAGHLGWLAPLFARITVGWVFLLSGWGKLQNLPQVTENFIGWGIPFPHFFTPLTSGIEFVGGLFLLLGLLTRISAGALGITMIVAIKAAKWGDVDSLETLLGFDEFDGSNDGAGRRIHGLNISTAAACRESCDRSCVAVESYSCRLPHRSARAKRLR